MIEPLLDWECYNSLYSNKRLLITVQKLYFAFSVCVILNTDSCPQSIPPSSWPPIPYAICIALSMLLHFSLRSSVA